MKQLAKLYGVEDVSDWRRVGSKEVKASGGHTLLSNYGSTQSLIEEFVPGMKGMDPTRFRNRVPRGWWDCKENRRNFLTRVGQELGVETMSDWKMVSREAIGIMGGAGLLARYKFSLNALLKDTFDCNDDRDIGRKTLPPDHWESMTNRRQFFDGLEKELGIRSAEEWARVTCAEVGRRGGRTVLGRYNGSLVRALQDVYPEREFEETERVQVPVGHWDKRENREKFLRNIAEQKGIETPADWAKISRKEFAAMGGVTLLAKWGTIQRILEGTFGEFSANEKRQYILQQPNVPPSFWDCKENIVGFIHDVQSKLSIRSAEDWARVSHKQIRQLKGGGLLKNMSLFEALRLAYPNVEWENIQESSSCGKKSSQRHLFLALQHIVPQGPTMVHQ